MGRMVDLISLGFVAFDGFDFIPSCSLARRSIPSQRLTAVMSGDSVSLFIAFYLMFAGLVVDGQPFFF
jgi:hypothetical protein